jgi:hypothetical protein
MQKPRRSMACSMYTIETVLQRLAKSKAAIEAVCGVQKTCTFLEKKLKKKLYPQFVN